MLIKRGLEGGKLEEQLLIGQVRSEEHPDGNDLLLLCPDETKGVLSNIRPYMSAENPMLFVAYHHNDNNTVTLDAYALPLGRTGAVDSVVGGEGVEISFDGATLSAEGTIEVFNLQGMRVLTGAGQVNAGSLTPGLYVVRANGQAVKFIVK